LIESILLAASLPDAEISARLANIGPDYVAEVMLAEVACRAALLNGPQLKFVIQCDLGFADERLGYLLRWATAGQPGCSARRREDGRAWSDTPIECRSDHAQLPQNGCHPDRRSGLVGPDRGRSP
jgi:hypothetical protein